MIFTREECMAQVEDFEGVAWFQMFDTREEAEKFVSDPLGVSVCLNFDIKENTPSIKSLPTGQNIFTLPTANQSHAAGASRSGKYEKTYYAVAKGEIPGIYTDWYVSVISNIGQKHFNVIN